MKRLIAGSCLAALALLPACKDLQAPGHGTIEADPPNERELWSSLQRYEVFVRKHRDPEAGIAVERGEPHPACLASFARLYLALWRRQKREDDRKEYVRILEVIRRGMRPDGTWASSSAPDRPSLRAGARFVEVFLEAAGRLQDPKYRDWAVDAARGLKGTAGGGDGADPEDDPFPAAAAIARVLSGGLPDPELNRAGRAAAARSLAAIDRASGRWYLSPERRREGRYEGADARAQLDRIAAYLDAEAAFRAVYPDVHLEMEGLLPRMDAVVEDRVLPSGAFRIDDALPDPVESAALTVWGFAEFDRKYGTRHHDAIDRAVRTILERQYTETEKYGAYRTGPAEEKNVPPRINDGVAWYAAKFLLK